MTLTVLTAVVGAWEAPLVSGLERSAAGVQVVRRCADLSELLSAAAAGLARAVVLSSDLQRLDRAAVEQLLAAGVAVVGLAGPGDAAAARRLANLGVQRVLPADAPVAAVAEAVTAAVADLAEQPQSVWSGVGLADAAAAAAPIPPARRAGGAGEPRPRGVLVAVWGPGGAPGRTTVAVALAAELAAAGQEALLVDADTHGASVAQSLGLLDESAGIAAAARAANQGTLDLPKLAALAPPVAEGLRVLTGLPQPRRWPELRATALDVVWQRARELATWTVIDAGFGLEADEELMFDTAAPRRHGATLCALAAADLVVAVGGAEPISLQRLLAGLPDLAQTAPPGAPVRVVINRVRDAAVGGAAAGLIRGALDRYAGVADAALVPDDRPALDAAMLAGRSLTEHAPASPARRALVDLAARVASDLGRPLGEAGRRSAKPARPARARWGGGRRSRSDA
jgi:MinD-like ATPase involved in chromosome partitioning or flagellar assembly